MASKKFKVTIEIEVEAGQPYIDWLETYLESADIADLSIERDADVSVFTPTHFPMMDDDYFCDADENKPYEAWLESELSLEITAVKGA